MSRIYHVSSLGLRFIDYFLSQFHFLSYLLFTMYYFSFSFFLSHFVPFVLFSSCYSSHLSFQLRSIFALLFLFFPSLLCVSPTSTFSFLTLFTIVAPLFLFFHSLSFLFPASSLLNTFSRPFSLFFSFPPFLSRFFNLPPHVRAVVAANTTLLISPPERHLIQGDAKLFLRGSPTKICPSPETRHLQERREEI